MLPHLHISGFALIDEVELALGPGLTVITGETGAEELDDGLVVRRVIARQGRGRAHLGGGLATAGDLAKHVAGLIDIASQHDQQSLTDPESQLAILDAFAENEDARAEM